jgi:hypothetical protein
VQKSFLAAFEQYGLPQSLLCDNGNPWGTAQSTGYTMFEVWLMDLGILTKHGRIRHPQTQGKEERFNGTLLKERLKYREYNDLSHAQQDFDEYRQFYNCERPHHALDLQTPADRYYISERKLPIRISEWDYEPHLKLRRIRSSGYFSFRGQGYFLSEAFGGKTVAFREADDEKGVFLVIYRQFCVARLSVDNRVVLARKAFRYQPDSFSERKSDG